MMGVDVDETVGHGPRGAGCMLLRPMLLRPMLLRPVLLSPIVLIII